MPAFAAVGRTCPPVPGQARSRMPEGRQPQLRRIPFLLPGSLLSSRRRAVRASPCDFDFRLRAIWRAKIGLRSRACGPFSMAAIAAKHHVPGNAKPRRAGPFPSARRAADRTIIKGSVHRRSIFMKRLCDSRRGTPSCHTRLTILMRIFGIAMSGISHPTSTTTTPSHTGLWPPARFATKPNRAELGRFEQPAKNRPQVLSVLGTCGMTIPVSMRHARFLSGERSIVLSESAPKRMTENLDCIETYLLTRLRGLPGVAPVGESTPRTRSDDLPDRVNAPGAMPMALHGHVFSPECRGSRTTMCSRWLDCLA